MLYFYYIINLKKKFFLFNINLFNQFIEKCYCFQIILHSLYFHALNNCIQNNLFIINLCVWNNIVDIYFVLNNFENNILYKKQLDIPQFTSTL